MTAKRKIYLINLSFLTVFCLGIIFGVLPLLAEIKKSSEDLRFQKRAFNLFQNQLTDLENFQKDYSSYQSTLEKIKKSFVSPDVPIRFIEFLEKEARESEIEIEIFPLTFSSPQSDSWKSTGFRIFVGGPFSNCLRFLERLEQSSYLVEIFQLNIERMGEKGQRRFESLSPGDVIFNISLKTFSGETPDEKEK
ncbi:hypothetical protein J7K42_02525 [bacterium]|nr:hypothetical protein [bacterium]